MRLSIVPVDGVVVVDGSGWGNLTWEGTPSDIHALQWDTDKGHIEYAGHVKHNDTITELPQWALNAIEAWDLKANPPPEPVLPNTAELNSNIAKGELFQTDWVENPTVRDPNRHPHLANAAEFDDYREQIRRIALFPTAGDLEWPVKPTADWR